MSSTTVELLRAASEIAGGKEALARRLRIGEALLSRYMDNRNELPDALLLAAVDIILEDRDRQAKTGLRPSVARSAQETLPNG